MSQGEYYDFRKEIIAKYMVMKYDLTLGGGHTMHYSDHVSWNCIPETYIILLTQVTLINLI